MFRTMPGKVLNNNPRVCQVCQAAIRGCIIWHRQRLLGLPDLSHVILEVVIKEVLRGLTNALVGCTEAQVVLGTLIYIYI